MDTDNVQTNSRPYTDSNWRTDGSERTLWYTPSQSSCSGSSLLAASDEILPSLLLLLLLPRLAGRRCDVWNDASLSVNETAGRTVHRTRRSPTRSAHWTVDVRLTDVLSGDSGVESTAGAESEGNATRVVGSEFWNRKRCRRVSLYTYHTVEWWKRGVNNGRTCRIDWIVLRIACRPTRRFIN